MSKQSAPIRQIIEISGIAADEIDLKCTPHEEAEIDDFALQISGQASAENEQFRRVSCLSTIPQPPYQNPATAKKNATQPATTCISILILSRTGSGSTETKIRHRLIRELETTRSSSGTFHEGFYKVYRHFGIEIKARDALSDIRATRKLFAGLL